MDAQIASSVSGPRPPETSGDREAATLFVEEFLRRLEAAEAVEPGPLAEMFRMGFAPTSKGAAVLGGLQTFLARLTLAHARAQSLYYRSRPSYDAGIGKNADHTPDLSALPTIDRTEVKRHFAEFVAENVKLRSVCHTSGTTGSPLEIYKSHEEIAFLGQFFTTLFKPAYRTLGKTLSLSFPTPHHGVPIPMPTPSIPFVGGVTDDTLIKDAARVLSTSYLVDGEARRISQLQGMAFQVLFFTNYLMEQGTEPSSFGIELINIAGGFVPAHWRTFLAQAWNCTVNDRFSLTETVGGATRCHQCGAFRPDPQLLFEALDIETGRPLEAGIGKLCVTNLYPFAQMMPLIRYETGDLARRRLCCTGVQAFDFLGRLQNCASLGSGRERRWLIFSSELHEVLATLPDLNVYQWFSNVRAARDRTVGSLPITALKQSAGADGRLDLALNAELRYSPHTFPARADEVRRCIVDHLVAVEDTELAAALADGSATFSVNFLPPQGLEDDYVIKI